MPKKKKSDITKVGAGGAIVLPGYMAGAPLGTEDLEQYIIPPRIKVVQKQADELLLSKFNVGDVILVPNQLVVAEMTVDDRGRPTDDAESFFVVPVYFYAEWCTWNPIQMRGQTAAIRERSQDPKSTIAQKAKNAELRYEPHPDNPEYNIRHVEHLNFIVLIRDHSAFTDEPCIVSFSRGEHGAGQRFCSLLRMRKAPIYGCVFQCRVGPRNNQQGDWFGIDVANPDEPHPPWVTEDEFEAYKELHGKFAELHKGAKIRVEYEDREAAPADAKEEF